MTKPIENHPKLTFFAKIAWPVAVLLIALMMRGPLTNAIPLVQEVGSAGFYVRFDLRAVDSGVPDFPSELRALSYDAMRVFILLGGRSGDQMTYRSPYDDIQTDEIYAELTHYGLIELLATDDEILPKVVDG